LGIPAYYDTSNDAFVAPNDALAVINFINAFGAEAEGESAALGDDPPLSPAGADVLSSDFLALLALDVASQIGVRRRGGL
jgi:hypothetical protein